MLMGTTGGAQGRTASPAGGVAAGKAPVRKVARISEKHPAMSSVGGHAMPSTGTVGGARGVGGAAAVAAAAAAAALKASAAPCAHAAFSLALLSIDESK